MRILLSFAFVTWAFTAFTVGSALADEDAIATAHAVQRILDSQHPDIRASYSWTDVQIAELRRIEDRDAVTAELTRILGDREAPQRWRNLGTEALARIRPVQQQSRAAMGKLILTPIDPQDRVRAMRALGQMGADAEPWIDLIARFGQDSDVMTRVAVAIALTDIGRATEYRHAAIDATLLAALNDESEVVRHEAVEYFRVRNLASAAPQLGELLRDPDPRVRCLAALAVWQTTGEGTCTLPVLVDVLRTGEGEVRLDAAHYLRHFGGAAAEALPILRTFTDFDGVPAFTNAADSLRYRLKMISLDTIKQIEQVMAGTEIKPAGSAPKGVSAAPSPEN